MRIKDLESALSSLEKAYDKLIDICNRENNILDRRSYEWRDSIAGIRFEEALSNLTDVNDYVENGIDKLQNLLDKLQDERERIR